MENSQGELKKIAPDNISPHNIDTKRPVAPSISEPISTLKTVETEKAVEKEPWQITRDDFLENYYLHGTPEENLPAIKKAGGISKGAFIKIASDRENTAVAYATGAEESKGHFSRSGRGTKNGFILVAELNDIISPEPKKRMAKEQQSSGDASENPKLIFVEEQERRVGKYKAIIPIDVDPHRYLIEQAIEKGEKIPQEVLKDYPDIALKLGIKPQLPDTTGPEYQWGSISFRHTGENPEICTTEKLEYWVEQYLKRFQDTKTDTSLAIRAFLNELEYRAKNNGKNKRNWQFEVPKKEYLKQLRDFTADDNNASDQKKVGLTHNVSFLKLIRRFLTREKHVYSTNEEEFNPEGLIADLKKDFNLNQEYAYQVGVWEGYTLEQHTLMVMRQFERYFSENWDASLISKNEIRTLLAVHDLGKVRAIMDGQDKTKQHEYNKKIIPGILRMAGIQEKKIYLMTEIASQDWIGYYMQGKITLEKAASEIQKMSDDQNVDLHQLFNILEIYYISDASSYTVDAGGKQSLDQLFEFKRADGEEKGLIALSEDAKQKMELLKTSLLNSKK